MFKKLKDEDEIIKDIFVPHSSDDSDPDEWWNRWNRFALRLIVVLFIGSAAFTMLNIFIIGPFWHKPLGFFTWLGIVLALIVAWEIL